MPRSFALLVLVPVLLGGLAGTAFAGHSAKVATPWVGAGKARSVRVDLTMQPGNLTIRGGARHLFDARIDYNPSAWKPTISYSLSGTRGHLVVQQPYLQSVQNARNTWDVRLADRMPLDLNVTSGPGNATLGLRSLKLGTLAVRGGPGNVSIDAGSPSLKRITALVGPGNLSVNLIAPWKHNVVAMINGGTGYVTLRLPEKVGSQVIVHSMGRIEAPGFTKRGSAYTNSAFGHSKVTVRVTLSVGIGIVDLKSGT
jgi:hypothetical protein